MVPSLRSDYLGEPNGGECNVIYSAVCRWGILDSCSMSIEVFISIRRGK